MKDFAVKKTSRKTDMGILFAPVSIGKATVKNRLVFPSMCTFYADDRGSITPRVKEFVRARAAGGVGMFILPGTPYGTPNRGRPAISDDQHIRGWQELKGIAFEFGMSLFCQLHHSNIRPELARSSHPEEYTFDDISFLVEAFARGALRARKAGLDGVEIHGAASSEIAEFLSPFHNRRHDEYGGGLEGRSRLALEIVRAIKRTAGDEFPVIFRFSVEERIPGGRELAESLQLARLLAEAGADALHATAGTSQSVHWGQPPMDLPPGCNVPLASAVRGVVAIPVIAVGRVNSLSQAAKIIVEGHADLVAMGRALLADPDLPTKSLAGRSDEIRRCIACNQGCMTTTNVFCLQTPRTGREATPVFQQKDEVARGDRKTVLIAGAGPAGLEAACVLAERGHRVIICEEKGEAGGTLLLAAKPPHKRSLLEVIRYRLRCLKRLGVEIEFNKRIVLQTIEDIVPDMLVVATGSSAACPPFPVNGKQVYTADEVLSGKQPGGKHVLLVGDGMVGCEVADYLANRGYRIDLVTESESAAPDLSVSRRVLLLERLKKRGVRFILGAKVISVDFPKAQLIVSGKQETVGDYDSVVFTARRANNELAEVASNCSFPLKVLTVGDAFSPRTALEAIYEAALVSEEV